MKHFWRVQMNNSNKNELAFYHFEDAAVVAKILTRCGYACLLTREEELTVLNYEYAVNYNDKTEEPQADRNQVVFMSLDEYYSQLYNEEEEEEEKQFDFENGAVQNTTPVELNENEFMHDELFK